MWLDGAEVAAEVRAPRPDYAALLIVAEGLLPGLRPSARRRRPGRPPRW